MVPRMNRIVARFWSLLVSLLVRLALRLSHHADANQCTSEQDDHHDTCPICLERLDSGTPIAAAIPCGHVYHEPCLRLVEAQHLASCPLCLQGIDRVCRLFVSRLTLQNQRQQQPSDSCHTACFASPWDHAMDALSSCSSSEQAVDALKQLNHRYRHQASCSGSKSVTPAVLGVLQDFQADLCVQRWAWSVLSHDWKLHSIPDPDQVLPPLELALQAPCDKVQRNALSALCALTQKHNAAVPWTCLQHVVAVSMQDQEQVVEYACCILSRCLSNCRDMEACRRQAEEARQQYPKNTRIQHWTRKILVN